jgi:hypothetical protein
MMEHSRANHLGAISIKRDGSEQTVSIQTRVMKILHNGANLGIRGR